MIQAPKLERGGAARVVAVGEGLARLPRAQLDPAAAPPQRLGFALRLWLGASLVAFVCGAIRELCATGSLFGFTILSDAPRLPVAQMAMGGFILLAFFAAFCRTIHRLILALAMKADTPKGGEEQ